MPTVNINIRMDEDLKRQFESFCADTGHDVRLHYFCEESAASVEALGDGLQPKSAAVCQVDVA